MISRTCGAVDLHELMKRAATLTMNAPAHLGASQMLGRLEPGVGVRLATSSYGPSWLTCTQAIWRSPGAASAGRPAARFATQGYLSLLRGPLKPHQLRPCSRPLCSTGSGGGAHDGTKPDSNPAMDAEDHASSSADAPDPPAEAKLAFVLPAVRALFSWPKQQTPRAASAMAENSSAQVAADLLPASGDPGVSSTAVDAEAPPRTRKQDAQACDIEGATSRDPDEQSGHHKVAAAEVHGAQGDDSCRLWLQHRLI